jgi:photosystem II stability/assembly factor-like uncharacterized protein
MAAAMTSRTTETGADRARRGWQASIGRNLPAVSGARTLPRALTGLLLALVLLACAAPPAGAAEVPSEWTWTDYGPTLRDVSCASPGHCVAVGQRGMVLRSRHAGDDGLDWSEVPFKYPEELDGVACTPDFCLTVSNTRTGAATYTSKVFRSDDGGATWSAGVALPPAGTAKTRSALSLACSGATCYAAGPTGGLWRSTDGGVAWEALTLPPGKASYSKIVCPSAGVCVAAGGDEVGYSTLIEGTVATPLELPAKFAKGAAALACDSAARCVGADGLGHYALLDVAAKKWGVAKLFPKALVATAISCPGADKCVALTGGLALRTTALGDGVWKRRPIGTLSVDALDCVETDCVAVGEHASWWAGDEVGFDWERLNEVAKLEAIQCGGDLGKGCVAGGEKDLGVSRSGGELWALPLSGYSGLDVKSVECSGLSECLFLGKTLTLFTKDLISFAARHPTITDPKGTDAQTCITKEICVGINEGVVYTTLDGAVTDWNHNAFPEKATSVACIHGQTAPAQCLATTREFLALGTMTHDDGQIRWKWRYTDADPGAALEAVGCSPEGQCTAVGGGGTVLTSQGHDLMHWNELILPTRVAPGEKRPLLKSVACPADGVCLAGGIHGADAIIASTKDNWADYAYEKIEGIEGAAPTVAAFGCESVDRCVAVGGTSLIGRRKP